jgi:hypothetical protein
MFVGTMSFYIMTFPFYTVPDKLSVGQMIFDEKARSLWNIYLGLIVFPMDISIIVFAASQWPKPPFSDSVIKPYFHTGMCHKDFYDSKEGRSIVR